MEFHQRDRRSIAVAAAAATVAPATAAAAVAAAPAAPAAAGTAARALLARLGLIDRQGTALELGAVHRRDGGLGAVAHLDEAETARPAGLAVLDHLGTRDRAVLAERLDQVVGRR